MKLQEFMPLRMAYIQKRRLKLIRELCMLRRISKMIEMDNLIDEVSAK